jgi:hypothetical protein
VDHAAQRRQVRIYNIYIYIYIYITSHLAAC